MKVKIHDSTFTPFVKSATLRGDNAGVMPEIEWVKPDEPADSDAVVWTDGHIKDVTPGENNIAWLIEPKHLRPENYLAAHELQDLFRVVFTYDDRLLGVLKNGRFYPLGGSSIAFDQWGYYEKTKRFCMFVSGKREMEGHKLRHEIARRYGHIIDCYGEGVGRPVARKFDMLKDYEYCIVVESGRHNYYFSEKIVDPISVGTVPLYWGCPYIAQFFLGITKWNMLDELERLLERPYGKHYKANQLKAVQYRTAERYLLEEV